MLHGGAAHSSRAASEYAYGDIFNQYVPLTVPSDRRVTFDRELTFLGQNA
jgi:hypothetical protein